MSKESITPQLGESCLHLSDLHLSNYGNYGDFHPSGKGDPNPTGEGNLHPSGQDGPDSSGEGDRLLWVVLGTGVKVVPEGCTEVGSSARG